ncbi:MAG: hypothetical protein ACI3Y4_09190 [Candidatus Cryptobacteroides sp.]
MFCAPSCRKTTAQGPAPVDTDTAQLIQEVKDSLTLTVKSRCKVKTLDILVYGGAPLLSLESCTRCEGELDPLSIELKDTLPKTVVVLGNMPGELNPYAVVHFDALERLEMNLGDDDPGAPFLSGKTEWSGGCCEVELMPLLCCVVIESVTNMNDDYTLLENPRVWLSGINTRAALMQTTGFRASETAEGKAVRLPCDIGLYTQYPGTRLWCYPLDLTDGQGAQLMVEFGKRSPDGEYVICRTAFDLGPVFRASEVVKNLNLK